MANITRRIVRCRIDGRSNTTRFLLFPFFIETNSSIDVRRPTVTCRVSHVRSTAVRLKTDGINETSRVRWSFEMTTKPKAFSAVTPGRAIFWLSDSARTGPSYAGQQRIPFGSTGERIAENVYGDRRGFRSKRDSSNVAGVLGDSLSSRTFQTNGVSHSDRHKLHIPSCVRISVSSAKLDAVFGTVG